MNYDIAMVQKQDIFDLMGGKVRFFRGIYNPTADAVFLAAFAPDAKTVLDVGIGTGGVALCYNAHHPDAVITGLDVCESMLDVATQNTVLNNRSVEIIHSDIFSWSTNRTFDLVMTNPPYFQGTPAKHNAHHNVDIKTWVTKCMARVKPRGHFCTIIDALVLSDVISALNPTFGDITILPLYGAKQTAERVLVRARLGVKGGTVLHSGLSMNDPSILRDGLTIDL